MVWELIKCLGLYMPYMPWFLIDYLETYKDMRFDQMSWIVHAMIFDYFETYKWYEIWSDALVYTCHIGHELKINFFDTSLWNR